MTTQLNAATRLKAVKTQDQEEAKAVAAQIKALTKALKAEGFKIKADSRGDLDVVIDEVSYGVLYCHFSGRDTSQDHYEVRSAEGAYRSPSSAFDTVVQLFTAIRAGNPFRAAARATKWKAI